MFGWQEWALIILVVVLIFGGAKKLPDLARSLGKAMQEFKKAVKDVKETKDEIVDDVVNDLDEESEEKVDDEEKKEKKKEDS